MSKFTSILSFICGLSRAYMIRLKQVVFKNNNPEPARFEKATFLYVAFNILRSSPKRIILNHLIN